MAGLSTPQNYNYKCVCYDRCMLYNRGKVVKCKRSQCGLYFTHTEKDTKCPFCKTEYGKAEEKVEEKKEATKTQKKSFKIWK